MAEAPKITIDELEAKYPLYCKALKLLVKDDRGEEEIRRSLCWDRLRLLHRSLPGRYKSPEHLMDLLQRPQSAA
jgi:hypothetical protein